MTKEEQISTQVGAAMHLLGRMAKAMNAARAMVEVKEDGYHLSFEAAEGESLIFNRPSERDGSD